MQAEVAESATWSETAQLIQENQTAPKKQIDTTSQSRELSKSKHPKSRSQQEWWYLIESGPAGLGQIGPLVEEQAHRLIQRLMSQPTEVAGAGPVLYQAPSLAAALDLHQRYQQLTLREVTGVHV